MLVSKAEKCDRCGKICQPEDNAVNIMAETGMFNPFNIFLASTFHIRCSPSRAQYIVHPAFPPVFDNRPEYDKRLIADNSEMEEKYTKAWMKLRQS
jgi:hypothetical protein